MEDQAAYERMAHAVNPYGDGCAAARSVTAIRHFFGLGPRPAEFGVAGPGADVRVDLTEPASLSTIRPSVSPAPRPAVASPYR
jgi:hypothetical protein